MQQTRKQIKKYLESGHSINSLKAFELFRTLSLQQHIHALRRQGAPIETTIINNMNTGVRYAEYYYKKSIGELKNVTDKRKA